MNVRDPCRARVAHEALRCDGALPQGLLDAAIESSWQRSSSYGLREGHRPDLDCVPHADFDIARESSRTLLAHAQPAFAALRSEIESTGGIILLTDGSGLVLESVGDRSFLSRAARVALRPGVSWCERSKGTNAIGTAIADQAPSIVHGPEHFLLANEFLSCSAVPIFDPFQNIVGVLDISGEAGPFQRHTLALVKMSVQLMENRLFVSLFAGEIVVEFHSRPEFIGTLSQGMIALRPDGSIVAANPIALEELGLGRNSLRSHSFGSLFGTPLSTLLDAGRRGRLEMCELRLADGTRFHARVRGIVGAPVAISVPAREFEAEAPHRTQRPPAAMPHKRVITLAALRTGDAGIDTALARLSRVIGRDIPILIQGETGTGKELVAQAIHNESCRRNGPFVAVNCASIPEGLIESELFGYEEGAFSGAKKRGSLGKIMAANHGTLFLDEIGDMPLNLQARLLRVLQERVVMPLGSVRSQPVDIALICATHRRLKELIVRGQFREDLYYRLNGLTINLPPLRERSDVATLADRILRCELNAPPEVSISPGVLDLFSRHPWPGNCRQLANVLRTALVMAGEDKVIDAAHLPEDFLDDLEAASDAGGQAAGAALRVDAELAELEFAAIQKSLAETDGNVSASARRLGISRSTIYRRLKEHLGRSP
jgi:transcriptional regulator of acetoin/glycerol metabolism